MFKNIILFFIFSITLLNGSVIETKIKNIIGNYHYSLHEKLINHLYKEKNKFIMNDKISYYNVFSTLRKNGLLNLKLDKPDNIELVFKALNNNKLAFKILNDTMRSIGYGHIYTKKLEVNKNDLNWNIRFKAEYMTDPVVLIKELQQKNCKVTNVENRGSNTWYYEIDFVNSVLKEATKIDKDEKVKFQKPLQEYFLMVDNVKQLQVMSRKLNNWYPYISFFDQNLNVLGTIRKNREYEGIRTKIPKSTKYIKIADSFNLINIKRGLTVIVR